MRQARQINPFLLPRHNLLKAAGNFAHTANPFGGVALKHCAYQRHERLRQTVSSLQESLDYLRLSIKYLVFDLEATRRENGYLRKMLEETRGGEERD